MMKQLENKSKIIQRDEIKQLIGNKTSNDRLDRTIKKLMDDGVICQAHDTHSYCFV